MFFVKSPDVHVVSLWRSDLQVGDAQAEPGRKARPRFQSDELACGAQVRLLLFFFSKREQLFTLPKYFISAPGRIAVVRVSSRTRPK
jgi:hypothetical protein